MTREQIEQAVWNFLKSKGLSDLSTSAVMGNIEAESEFDPSLVEVGNGIGIGLCQWSYGRRTKLEAYGLDLTHQLNFLWSELSGNGLSITGASFEWIQATGYLSHSDFMSGNGSLNNLTSAFCFCWERPNVLLAHLDRRQNSALGYYNKYSGTVLPTPSTPPDEVPLFGGIKLKNKYIYGFTDSWLGKKFSSKHIYFILNKKQGGKSFIIDGGLTRYVINSTVFTTSGDIKVFVYQNNSIKYVSSNTEFTKAKYRSETVSDGNGGVFTIQIENIPIIKGGKLRSVPTKNIIYL